MTYVTVATQGPVTSGGYIDSWHRYDNYVRTAMYGARVDENRRKMDASIRLSFGNMQTKLWRPWITVAKIVTSGRSKMFSVANYCEVEGPNFNFDDFRNCACDRKKATEAYYCPLLAIVNI